MQHGHAEQLNELATMLLTGHSPVEVAASMRRLADSLHTSHMPQETASTVPPDHVTVALSDITGRLQALHDAMREAAKKDALHPSVRFICDTIALNLAAPTGGQTTAPSDNELAGARVRIKGDGQWRGWVVRSNGDWAMVALDHGESRSVRVDDLIVEGSK